MYQVYPLIYEKELRGFDEKSNRNRILFYEEHFLSSVEVGNHVTRIGNKGVSFITLTIVQMTVMRDWEGLNQGSDKRDEKQEIKYLLVGDGLGKMR